MDPTICRVIELFLWMGIWRNESESNFRKSFVQILYFLQYVSFFICISNGVYQAYLSENMNQLSYLVGVQIGALIILLKLAYLLWRKDEIFKFLYDLSVTHSAEDYGDTMELKIKIENIAILYKAYISALAFALLFLILFPLRELRSEEKILPLFIQFNLGSDHEMIFYWIAYIYAAVCCFLSVAYTFTSIFVWHILCSYSIEYKLLGNRFLSLGKTATPNKYEHEFAFLIRSHNNLYDTIKQFRSCFSTLFLVEMITGGIFICVSTFNLSYNTTENVFEMAYYVVFLLYAFFEIFIIMYLANEITIECDRISYSVFASNWIDQSNSTKKSVIIFCEMIKRPQELIIFVYPMNLITFTSIVNGSYRLFNVLNRFK